MLRSTLHTIMTHRFAVGLSAVALLGGGAALASPAGPFDLLPNDIPDGIPATDAPDVVSSAEPEVELPEVEALVDPEEVVGEDLEVPEGTEVNDEPEEDDGNAWALGRADGDDQQTRVADFCEERVAEAEAADGVEGAEAPGIPSFCREENGGPVPPNAHGRDMAQQARSGERPDGSGRPPWAGSNRPDDVPPGPPADVPRGDDANEDDDSVGTDPADTETVAPAGESDVEQGGPPAHANARANRD
jgi:hypothetical protein